ncbi:hypothetical protein MMOR_49050 [Mycolicibacterium moriokaense]|uniref:Uncharacterized protein n=1 Tax=Mycolicibacterium moriokaense TaxID=39691 RepID=A0AAD1HG02_9MYCO|nr:hypothetical protein MMOR_49050 [Mycolicibacterium moriokaense]
MTQMTVKARLQPKGADKSAGGTGYIGGAWLSINSVNGHLFGRTRVLFDPRCRAATFAVQPPTWCIQNQSATMLAYMRIRDQ